MEKLELAKPLISLEESKRQRDELTRIHMEWLAEYPRKLPPTLQHYTNAVGFHGIVKEQRMRATHISYLNDSSEYFHAIRLMRGVINSVGESPLKKIRHDPLEIMASVLDTLDQESMPPVFVVCFSEAKNELSQWRSYGQGEGGISIQMDARLLADTANARGWEIHPVEYNMHRQTKLIIALVSWACGQIEQIERDYREEGNLLYVKRWLSQFMYHAAYFAPLFKNDAFKQENEWRIIKWGIDPETLLVDVGGSTLKLRTELDLRCEMKASETVVERLPITEVMIGPTPHTFLAKHAALHHLQKHQCFDVNVTTANIPFRVIA